MSHHTWIHKIARLTVSNPLAATRVSPNQITTARLTLGLTAAGFLALGDEAWRNIGAGVFVVAMILDRADGDFARLTGRTSPDGHIFDLISDSICNAIIFVGLGVGLRESDFGLYSILLGLLAGSAVATVLWLVIRIEELEGAGSAELGSFAGFDPDDAMLAVPILIWLGMTDGLLLAAAIGAPLFAAFFFWFSAIKCESRQPNRPERPASHERSDRRGDPRMGWRRPPQGRSESKPAVRRINQCRAARKIGPPPGPVLPLLRRHLQTQVQGCDGLPVVSDDRFADGARDRTLGVLGAPVSSPRPCGVT